MHFTRAGQYFVDHLKKDSFVQIDQIATNIDLQHFWITSVFPFSGRSTDVIL